MSELVIGGRTFRSRLFVGTGKFSSNELMARAIAASESEMPIVPQVQLNLQEEVNIYQMSKLICYLDGLQEIFKKLMIDEK